MNPGLSRWLALAGLVLLGLLLIRPPAFAPAGIVASIPLGLLIVAGLKPLSYWAVATAILMLPYFSYGVMLMLTDPDDRGLSVGLSALTIGVFLAALDTQRRARAA